MLSLKKHRWKSNRNVPTNIKDIYFSIILRNNIFQGKKKKPKNNKQLKCLCTTEAREQTYKQKTETRNFTTFGLPASPRILKHAMDSFTRGDRGPLFDEHGQSTTGVTVTLNFLIFDPCISSFLLDAATTLTAITASRTHRDQQERKRKVMYTEHTWKPQVWTSPSWT